MVVSAKTRLYMFDGGTMHAQLQLIKLNQGSEMVSFPIPWFLLTHPRGNVIIDGGNAVELANDTSHWGEMGETVAVDMTRDQAVVPALQNLGIGLNTVRWIVQTHLHADHTGAVGSVEHLPNAQVLCTRAEYAYAHAPDWFDSSSYVRADYVKPGVDWVLLEDDDDGYDLFGDDVVRLWRTPGHSVGHQSVEVSLPSGQRLFLAGDAAYTRDHSYKLALPGCLVSATDAVRSVRRMKMLADRAGALVVFGHDREQWADLRHAPEYYD
jgi:N-acyl homoserine lactone hydrolase